jgi:hypothetical protein
MMLGAFFWKPLASIAGSGPIALWCVFNGMLAVTNLMPFWYARFGRKQPSDGMQLLRLPFKKRTELEAYLRSTAIVTTLLALEDKDYDWAGQVARDALLRLPNDISLILILSACEIFRGEYATAREYLRPLTATLDELEPAMRAAVANNLAIAVWLDQPDDESALRRADELSLLSFSMYPCTRTYRSTRAYILAARKQANEALDLLEYPSYRRGSPEDRSSREIARAFALKQLDRTDEAALALKAGLALSKRDRRFLERIRLLPSAAI